MVAWLSSPGLRNTLLWLCVALPWLNPFTSPPSTSVLPLLLSWMMAACALLLVADLPMASSPPRQAAWMQASGALLVVAVGAALLRVPPVIDVGASAGLVAAMVCMGLMAWVGRRIACEAHGLMPWLVTAWLSAAIISSVLGLLQYLDLASSLSPWVNQPAFKGDAFANLRQRNQFASLTSIGLVALLAGAYALLHTHHTHTTVAQRRSVTLVAFVLLNVLAMGAACSMSRTGVLQWCVVSALAGVWAWRMRSRHALPAARHVQHLQGLRAWALLVVSAPLLLWWWSWCMPLVSQQLTGQQGASLVLRVAGSVQDYGVCGSRSVLWANVLQLIAQKPLFGWGWGETDLAHFLTSYAGPRFCDILDNAHNLPLHLALELGVPLALALLLWMGVWVWQRRPWQERSVWRAMAWGVLLVVGVHSVLEYPLWYGPFQMAVGLSVGLLWTLPPQEQTLTDAAQKADKASEAWSLAWASVFFLACLYAAWDFNRVSQIYKPVEQRDPTYSSNPLAHAQQSVLFRNQAAFAELTLQTVTASNAQAVYAQALRVVHYSPEPRVVQRLIDSARLLGYDEEADHWAARLAAHQQAVQR